MREGERERGEGKAIKSLKKKFSKHKEREKENMNERMNECQ